MRGTTGLAGHSLALAAIVAVYLLFAGAYALKTPKWNNPDEPAHFNYVRHIATTFTLPVLQMGDYDQAYLEKLKPLQFPDSLPIDPIRYESHQPPLYYLLAAGTYRLAEAMGLNATVLALRGFSIALGALLLVLAYLVVREALPRAPLLALGTAAVVAAVPMHLAMTAAINNDTLAEVIFTASLLLMVRGVRRGFSHPTLQALGVLLGLALLTKVTIYPALVLGGLALLARNALAPAAVVSAPAPILAGAGQGTANPPVTLGMGALVRQAGWVYGTALAVSAWWFVRNVLVYGASDPFGLGRHDLVVVGQPRTVFTPAALEYFLGTLFQSFWGQFGWMGIVVDRRIYYAAGVLSAFAVVGLLVFAWRVARRRDDLAAAERGALALLGAAVLCVAGLLIYYNLTFIQAQGRYLFYAIAPIGLYMSLGVVNLLPRVLAPLGLLSMYAGLLALDFLCLVRFIIPYFGT